MVPNNTNIFNIVESAVKDHENMMNSIITLVNDISRITKKLDPSKLTESITTLKTLNSVINEYSTTIGTIIKSIINDIPNSQSINDVLGYIEWEEINDNDIVIKSKYHILEVMSNVTEVIKTMYKSIDNMSKISDDFKSSKKIKKNIKYFGLITKSIIFEMSKVLSDASYQMDNLNNQNIQKIDTDAFKNIISAINDIIKFETPNKLILRAKLLSLRDYFNILFKSLRSLSRDFEKRYKTEINNLNVILSDKKGILNISDKFDELTDGLIRAFSKPGLLVVKYFVKQTSKIIVEISESVKEINDIPAIELSNDIIKLINDYVSLFNMINKLGIRLIPAKLLISNIDDIESIIWRLIDLNSNLDRREDSKFSYILTLVDGFKRVQTSIIALGLLALPATLAMKLSGIFIKSFDAFITLLNNSFKNSNIDHVQIALNNIKSILKNLLIVSIELIAFGVIAMKATKYLLIGSAYILGLFGFVLLVVNLMNTIRLAKVRKMQMITNMIVNIFKNLLLITAEIIIFALASPALIVACTVSLIAITAFVGLMWLISGVMGLLSKLSIKMTINTTVVGLTIAFVVGVLIASALALLALAKISEVVVPALLNIGILLGGIVVLIVALIGLGALLLAATPVIIPAMLGLGLVMLLIGELLLTALMLKGLSNIDIQKDTISDKIDNIKDIISIIRDGMVELALDNKFILQSTIGIRRTKRLTKQIRKIAENLNTIQSITLDKAAIDNNITKIFGVVGDVERRLLEFNRVKPLDKNGNDTESIIDKIQNARQQKRLLKQNTKVMRRTDRIVGEIYDITEKLNFIQGIELQEGVINDSVTKIFGIINNLETELSKFNTGVEVANSSSIDMISEIEKSKGKRKYFRQNKRTLNKVDRILGEVYDIAQKLDYLKSIDIKSDDVIVGVDKVFEVVTSVEKQLNTEMVVGRKDVEVFKNKLNIVNEINNFIEQFTIPTFKTIDSTPYSKFIESVNSILKQIDTQKVRGSVIERFNKNIGIIKNITIDINGIDKLTNDIDKNTYINIIDDIDLILSRISGGQQIKYNEFNKKLGAVKKAGKILTEFSHDFLSINTNDVDKVTENYIKFVDKINNSKLENLKTTANIFEKMARFSETINGNFEGLATTINDKLMPLLEELKETMNSVPDKLDKGFAGTQNSIYEASPNTSRNVSSFNNQVKAEAIATGKNVTEDEINRKAQNMMNQQMSNMSHGIEAKLDELIEILSGSLKVQME